MIRPALWREFFKPAYARLFELARNAGKQVWFHSDGAIAAIIPDLIEIGVQVLNPPGRCRGPRQAGRHVRGPGLHRR
jgi:uroporphyrinogen decarboxylase